MCSGGGRARESVVRQCRECRVDSATQRDRNLGQSEEWRPMQARCEPLKEDPNADICAGVECSEMSDVLAPERSGVICDRSARRQQEQQ